MPKPGAKRAKPSKSRTRSKKSDDDFTLDDVEIISEDSEPSLVQENEKEIDDIQEIADALSSDSDVLNSLPKKGNQKKKTSKSKRPAKKKRINRVSNHLQYKLSKLISLEQRNVI